jgi:protein O-mannosyl-transferase
MDLIIMRMRVVCYHGCSRQDFIRPKWIAKGQVSPWLKSCFQPFAKASPLLNNMQNLFGNMRRLDAALQFALIAAVVAVFWPVVQADFVHWDDGSLILNNPHLGLTWENLRWMFTDASYTQRYLPLGWLSYSIDHTFFHGSAFSYHLGNLLLHVANTLLVYAIVKRLIQFRQTSAGNLTLPLVASAIGALCWSLNPLRAEPIAWASSRIYCVAAMFFFLSLLLYVGRLDDSGTVEGRRPLLAAFFFGCSLLTYPIALGGLGVFVLLDISLLGRLSANPRKWWAPDSRKVWLEKAVFIIPAAIMFGANFLARFNYPKVYPVVSLEEFGLAARAIQALWVFAWFIWKPWLPIGLAPKYPDLLTNKPFTVEHIAAAALVLGISLLLISRRRVWPGVLIAWMCHLALLLPLTGITEHPHHTFDRYGYIVGIVWAVLIAGTVLRLGESQNSSSGSAQSRLRPLTVGLSLALLVSAWFGLLAQDQAAIWNNSFSLQTRIAASYGNRPEAAVHNVKAAEYMMELHHPVEAEVALRRALAISPEVPVTWALLGDALSDQNRVIEAIPSYQQALALDTNLMTVRQNLGVSLGMANRHEEALAQFAELLRREPNNASAHRNMAAALHSLGREDEAKKHLAEYQRLQKPKPDKT